MKASSTYLSLIISIIAAGAWIPILMEKFKRRKLKAKIFQAKELIIYDYKNNDVSLYVENNNSTLFLFRYKLVIENKDFFIDSFETKVKFKEQKDMKVFSEFYYPNTYYEKEGVGKRLSVPFSSMIIGQGTLKADTAYDLYSTVFINEKIENEIEWIEITLLDLQANKLKTRVAFDENLKLFEMAEDFWGEVSLL